MADQSYQLTMRSGPNPGTRFPFDQEEILLGRDLSNDITVGDPEVSRRHARFFIQDDNAFIEDLGSTNGTFLNGERISSPKQLRTGDVITFGENIVMVYEKGGESGDAEFVTQHSIDTTDDEMPPQFMDDEPKYYHEEPEPQGFEEPAPVRPVKQKRDGFPTWLIILIIAIVVLACVIAVTLYFMPASWWCAITFDMLEGCPVP